MKKFLLGLIAAGGMSMKFQIGALLLLSALAWGQSKSASNLSAGGTVDFSAATVTRPVQSGGSDPATCAAGLDLFINSSGTPAIKLCTATNTWSAFQTGLTGFNNVSGGTNTSAAMVVGSGASLAAIGTGAITATALSSTLTNPNILPNNNEYVGLSLTCNWDNNSQLYLAFTAQFCFNQAVNVLPQIGRNTYTGGSGASDTASKVTTIFDALTITDQSGGQTIAHNFTLNCWASGDCAKDSSTITCNSEVIAGDENSCGFSVVSRLQQIQALTKWTQSGAVVRSGCPSNMTFTQDVQIGGSPPYPTGGLVAQTVSVSSTTGCANGDWMAPGWKGAVNAQTGYIVNDPVQITVIDGTHISAKFSAFHANGDAIRAATVLTLPGSANGGQWGVRQWLVDLDGTSYSTGTAAISSNNHVVGTGTSWAANMVGGDATDPGCFAFTGDDQTYDRWSGHTLRSWWPIGNNTTPSLDGTHLSLSGFSVPGAAVYAGVGSGTYQILPCAQILYFSGSTMVLSPNTFAWGNGHNIEQRVVPDMDSAGFQYFVSMYTPATISRGFLGVTNNGGQQIACLVCAGTAQVGNNGSTDPASFGALVSDTFQHSGSNPVTNYGMLLAYPPKLGAMSIAGGFKTAASGFDNHIYWDESTGGIGTNNTTGVFEICPKNCGFPISVPNYQIASNLSVQVAVPANASSNCTVGMWAVAPGFQYNCVATNTWQRVATVTW